MEVLGKIGLYNCIQNEKKLPEWWGLLLVFWKSFKIACECIFLFPILVICFAKKNELEPFDSLIYTLYIYRKTNPPGMKKTSVSIILCCCGGDMRGDICVCEVFSKMFFPSWIHSSCMFFFWFVTVISSVVGSEQVYWLKLGNQFC